MAFIRTLAERLPALARSFGQAAREFLRPDLLGLLTARFEQVGEPSIKRAGGQVVAYHPKAREIGESILAAGGNAFDAFVATAVAENVLAEGASSLAGPLGVLVYRAEDGLVSYLDADFNDPLNPVATSAAEDSPPGKAVLVPGAPAGLEEMATRYGRLPLSRLLAPAISLAEEGFTVNRFMATLIAARARILKRTDYSRRTFFPGGRALKCGDTLRQPEVAGFLRKFAQHGSAYVYAGEFGRHFIETVQAAGGQLTEADLASYRVRWVDPWTTSYRGLTVHACSGRSYGGLWTLLALKTLENTMLPPDPHYSADPELLTLLIRIARAVWSEHFIFEDVVENDPAEVQSRLTTDYARQIWRRVIEKAPAANPDARGPHSYHIITRDSDGNIASGTTTIEAEPWGDGIFVEGLPLTTAGRVPLSTAPGRRRLSPFAMLLLMQDGRPRFSVGAISNSIGEAAFQLVVNLVDYGLPPGDAVSLPRFGTFPPVMSGDVLLGLSERNWLDPRIERRIVKNLRANGIKVKRAGTVDTGLGAVLAIHQDGTGEGVTVPLPYIANPFGASDA